MICARCCGWRRGARPSRALRSTPGRGERAGYDGGKRKKGSKVHMAVDKLGHLTALHVTPASAEDRGEVERLARTVQAVTDDAVELAWVDQGYTARVPPTPLQDTASLLRS